MAAVHHQERPARIVFGPSRPPQWGSWPPQYNTPQSANLCIVAGGGIRKVRQSGPDQVTIRDFYKHTPVRARCRFSSEAPVLRPRSSPLVLERTEQTIVKGPVRRPYAQPGSAVTSRAVTAIRPSASVERPRCDRSLRRSTGHRRWTDMEIRARESSPHPALLRSRAGLSVLPRR